MLSFGKKYHNYPSTTILKQVNVLAKVNKLSCIILLNLTAHAASSITTHVRTMTISEIIHKPKE